MAEKKTKKKVAKKKEEEVVVPSGPTRKDELLALHAELKSLGITRISDLEGLIARA